MECGQPAGDVVSVSRDAEEVDRWASAVTLEQISGLGDSTPEGSLEVFWMERPEEEQQLMLLHHQRKF